MKIKAKVEEDLLIVQVRLPRKEDVKSAEMYCFASNFFHSFIYPSFMRVVRNIDHVYINQVTEEIQLAVLQDQEEKWTKNMR